MSSLAMSAALIENENQIIGQENTLLSKKRQHNQHNKTQKKNTVNNDKINSVLETIHNSFNDEVNSMGDFIRNDSNYSADNNDQNCYNNNNNNRNSNSYIKKAQNIYKPLNPIDPPKIESMTTMSNTSSTNSGGMPLPMQDDNSDLQNLESAFMNNEQVNQYYRKLMTNTNNTPYTEKAKNYYEKNNSAYAFSQNNHNQSYSSSDGHKQLIDKLNYMINLLEEQQDERTGNVTEEVVLYSFLGIFIIFIADSFVRVGKYVR